MKDHDRWGSADPNEVRAYYAERVQELERQARFWEGSYRTLGHTVRDLKRHLRDRDAHIANLEAQLKPYIGHDTDAGEQEAML